MTTTTQPTDGYTIPRIVTAHGLDHGRPRPCSGCGAPIDRHHDSEYLALVAPARPRPLIAAACLPRHSGADDDR